MALPEHAIMNKISEEEMQEVYNWVDEIPLSRPKKNIARDFSDCGKYLKILNRLLTPFYSNSTCSRSFEALHPHTNRAPQLFKCSLCLVEKLQLEHTELEMSKEGRHATVTQRYQGRCRDGT
jgi:hypothetical protein